MTEHKYILEPYKGMNTRYRCPSCQQRDKTFSLYIDTEIGEHLHPTVGRCNRESNCGYHYTPKQYFQDTGISFNDQQTAYTKQKPVKPPPKPVSFIDVEVFKASLQSHEANHFVRFLIELFGVEIAGRLISKYFIGTSKHWNGANVFWQIDTHGKVRTGKIMLYSASTGKRVKDPFNHINWVHSVLNQTDFHLGQCLFGEHLLIDKTKHVAIVESEKTAVIASVYLPQFIWLAVGSLTNLNIDKCIVLKRRNVTLFPDLNGFEKWRSKSKELEHLTHFNISDLLERKATESERKAGLDLADYLVKFHYKEFVATENLTKPNIEDLSVDQPIIESGLSETIYTDQSTGKCENWEHDIKELEEYFTRTHMPTQPIKFNSFNTITNVSLFLEGHFATIKANNGKKAFQPYLNRLKELKIKIEHSLII